MSGAPLFNFDRNSENKNTLNRPTLPNSFFDSKPKERNNDRFIPSGIQKNLFETCGGMDIEYSPSTKRSRNRHNQLLKSTILSEFDGFEGPSLPEELPLFPQRMLSFNGRGPKKTADCIDFGPISATKSERKKSYSRLVNTETYKILDAPSLQDDYYFDIINWSATNLLSIGLLNHVYCLNVSSNDSFKIASYDNEALVSSIKSNQKGDLLSIGTTSGAVDIYDFESQKCLRSYSVHKNRVGAMAWKDSLIATGSRDGNIIVSDVRSRKDFEVCIESYGQEICGLSFNTFDYLLASGSNDNTVHVYDVARQENLHRFTEHKAAVKALAWSPHRNGLLASGGGSCDKTIKLWNTKIGQLEKSTDTGSQVCALAFSKNVNEVVSTHGFSQNQIEIWKAPEMTRVATLKGHTSRVLYLSMGPSGEDIVTASGDETLRFWKVFPKVNDGDQANRFSRSNTWMDLR